jgi:hypothetical protein
LILITFPVVLGSGKRLFSGGAPSGMMRMVDHMVSPQGTIIAGYEPVGAVKTGSFVSQEPGESEVARRKAMADGT